MSFVDPFFFIFLILSFAGFHLLNALSRRSGEGGVPIIAIIFLFLVSVYFYGYFHPTYLFLLLGSSFGAWFFALLLGGFFFVEKRIFNMYLSRKLMLFFAIISLLTPLFIFKYSNFFFSILRDIGFKNSEVIALALPLGISFFTFQNISYVTDVYRGTVAVEKNFLRYGLYISFFPQLVAGPIVTAGKFIPQLFVPIKFSEISLRSAVFYLLSGYIKKAVLADRLAQVADPVFSDPSRVGWIGIVIAVTAYSFQIYFDFSGYSDIAIGAGRLFGIDLPENFNFPYAAPGFRQFWRRWHITLSVWLRDHLYVPLGGSKNGAFRLVFSLLVTMLLGGLWHGPHWNFVLWGLAHGILLVLDRWIPERISNAAVLRQIYIIFTFIVDLSEISDSA